MALLSPSQPDVTQEQRNAGEEQVVLAPNLAKKASVRNWYKKTLAPLVQQIRDEKNTILRPQWLRYYNLWALRGTEAAYHGRLRMYLPIGHRILENWVQKLRGDIFPESGKWFRNTPDSTAQEDRAVVVNSLLMKLLKKQIRITSIFPGLLRNLGMFGTTIVEMGWKHDERQVPTLQRVLNKQTGESEVQETLRRTVKYLGPTMRVVDPFLFYVYPYTVQHCRDAELLFEDMLVGWDTLERMSKTDISPDHPELGTQVENWKEVKELRRGGSSGDDKFQAERDRLATRGLASKSDKVNDDPKRPCDLTKLCWYGAIDARGAESEDSEGLPPADEPQWWQIWVVGDDTVVHVRQNPWWKQEPQYLAAKFAELEGEFWGYGIMFLLDHFQYFMNDTMNQTGDGLVLTLNPIAAMDANAVQFPDSIRMSPGARWLIRSPRENVTWVEPPKDSAMAGIQVINFLVAMMNDVSNVAPFGGGGLQTAGRSRGRAVQTATGMSILSGEALLQVRDVEENIEQGILNDMLDWMFSMLQQCLDRDLSLRAVGADGAQLIETTINRDSLIGSYDFEWLGSTTSFNQNVKTQQMLNFIQILARIPPDFLAQDNARVDWKYLLRNIWSTGFGDKEASLIIKDIMPTRTVDAALENQLFGFGRGDEVTVSQLDDDMEHANLHNRYLQTEGPELPPNVQQELMQHIQRHAASYAMKQMQAQQQAQQAAMQQAMGGAAPQPGQPGQPGQPQMGGGGGGQGNGQGGPVMTPSRNVMPEPPGRSPQTANEGDVERRLPRGTME